MAEQAKLIGLHRGAGDSGCTRTRTAEDPADGVQDGMNQRQRGRYA